MSTIDAQKVTVDLRKVTVRHAAHGYADKVTELGVPAANAYVLRLARRGNLVRGIGHSVTVTYSIDRRFGIWFIFPTSAQARQIMASVETVQNEAIR